MQRKKNKKKQKCIHHRRLLVARYSETITCILSSVDSCAMRLCDIVLMAAGRTFNIQFQFSFYRRREECKSNEQNALKCCNTLCATRSRFSISFNCLPVSRGWQFFMQIFLIVAIAFCHRRIIRQHVLSIRESFQPPPYVEC